MTGTKTILCDNYQEREDAALYGLNCGWCRITFKMQTLDGKLEAEKCKDVLDARRCPYQFGSPYTTVRV